MKELIKVILTFKGAAAKVIIIETCEKLHETEIYEIIEKMFPFNFSIHYSSEMPEGYKTEYKNNLIALSIYKTY